MMDYKYVVATQTNDSEKANNGTPCTPLPNQASSTSAYGWAYFDIGACAVSFGSFVAIIALLHRYNGYSLPLWDNGPELNTLVSVLAAISKLGVVGPLVVYLCRVGCMLSALRGDCVKLDPFQLFWYVVNYSKCCY